MYNLEELKENKAEGKEGNINEFLNKEKISLEVSELIKENDYLSKALEKISKKLNDYQLKHVLNTAERAKLVAEGLLDDDQLKLLLKAALVHDVGKTEDDNISEIINRGEKLSEDERLKIKDHIGLMVDWGKKNNVPDEVIAVAARHHEVSGHKNNSNNYRRNGDKKRVNSLEDRREETLNSQLINRLGNILHIVDMYDSLRAQRSYKNSLEPEKCREEIIKNGNINSQEDREILNALIDSEIKN